MQEKQGASSNLAIWLFRRLTIARVFFLAIVLLIVIEARPLTLQSLTLQSASYDSPVAMAQPLSVTDVWRKVYERMPDLPRENQYLSIESGKPSTNNTLISRFIRYHVFVKGRPPMYRLDWKMTLGDYLGLNDLMQDGAYPGRDALQTNPIDGDRAAIQGLTRAQREQLVQVLVEFFNPDYAKMQAPASSSPPAEQSPNPTPTNPVSSPTKPSRSGADLLK